MIDFDTWIYIKYGLLSLFTNLLHNVFLLYHVEAFVSIYKIDKFSFWIGEAVFMVWNSFNDPLFGWQSDHKQLTSKSASENIIFKRLDSLSWNGPLLALSFLGFWDSFLPPSVQFVLCLCIYDTFLTKVELHHSALLADLTISAEKRTQLNQYSAAFCALGSISAFFSYMIWDRNSQLTFQMFCLSLTIIAIIGYTVSTWMLTNALKAQLNRSVSSFEHKRVRESSPITELSTHAGAMKSFIKDLTKHKNFVSFASMNLVQVFHCHFNSNFFPLFLETLLGTEVPSWVCSILLGVSFLAPHINNMYFLSLVRKYGVYRVINSLFYLKLLLGLTMLLIGPNYTIPLCLFIASNRVFTEGTCKLLNLAISNLVDEDYVIHKRKQAVSALMYGTSAFVSKPGQTLAPVLGTMLLSIQTGHDVFESRENHGDILMDNLSTFEQSEYRQGVFNLLVYVPIICALLQLFAWSKFSLHGKHLKWIKALREGVECAQENAWV